MTEKDKLLDHNYDGIQEYDNDLPRWWLAIFGLTAIFAVWYTWAYHFGSANLPHEQYAMDVKSIEELQAKANEAKGDNQVTEEDLLQLVKNDSAMANGKEVYVSKCAACHLEDGGGLVGPNLTDEYWIHDPSILGIRNIVVNGVPDKGMVPWKDVLTEEEINNVSAYVHSLKGTTPANPKPPQGEKVG